MALFSTCSLGQKPHRTHAVKAVLTVHVPLGLWQLKCRQCRRAGAGDPPPKCALCPGHADETLGKPGSPSSYDGRQPKFGAGELRHGTGLEDLTNFPPLYTLLPGLSPASTGDNMLLRELAAINRTPHSIQNGPTLTCIPTEKYPLNPNGSPGGIAGICSQDGRHLALMPHPERAVRPWQWAWRPSPFDALATSPWLQLFVNAWNWTQEDRV